MDTQAETVSTQNGLTIEWVMRHIDMIIKDTEYIKQAVFALDSASDRGLGVGIGNLVEARENTNQQTLRLLEKMYDDLKPPRPGIDMLLDKATEGLPPDSLERFLLEMARKTTEANEE